MSLRRQRKLTNFTIQMALVMLAMVFCPQINASPPSSSAFYETDKSMNSSPSTSAASSIPDLASAKALAQQILAREQAAHEWVILDHLSVEKEFGWVFFYTTKKYWETKNPRFMVPGNGPLLIERRTGQRVFLPTAIPPAQAIKEFEAMWQKQK